VGDGSGVLGSTFLSSPQTQQLTTQHPHYGFGLWTLFTPLLARRRFYPALLLAHLPSLPHVQLSIIALNFIYAVLGVILMYVSYRVIDRLTADVDFPAELKRGNIAVAIFIGALFLSIAVIIGGALN
jgi:hypothetical protein